MRYLGNPNKSKQTMKFKPKARLNTSQISDIRRGAPKSRTASKRFNQVGWNSDVYQMQDFMRGHAGSPDQYTYTPIPNKNSIGGKELLRALSNTVSPGLWDEIKTLHNHKNNQTAQMNLALAAALGGEPKFPGFMGPVAGRNTASMRVLHDLKKDSPLIAQGVDRADPRFGPQYPLRLDRAVFGYGPKDDFLTHLARLQDPVANREFLKWMMQHHYRRPN